MKRLMGLLLSMALLTIILAGCSTTSVKNDTTNAPAITQTSTSDAGTDADMPAWPRTIEDNFEHKVTFEKRPERLVVMYFGGIESSLILGTTPVGSSDARQAMAGFETLKKYADKVEIMDIGDRMKPNMESILALSPDLIIGTAFFNDFYKDLSKVAPTLIFGSTSWQEDINNYARCLGAEKDAAQYIEEVEALIADANKKMEAYRDKTFFIAFDYGKNTLMALGTTVWTTQVFFSQETGLGITPADVQPETFNQISIEALAEADPDYIIIAGQVGTEENDYEAVYSSEDTLDSSVWKSLKAVKNGNVIYIDPACITGSPLGVKLAVETITKNVLD